ncbi:MAG TPA: PIN domain-containing protein [Planctomycetaceae bacterium]
MIAIDTNVYVYALDDDEPDKQAKAETLFQRLLAGTGGSAVLMWQVAGELWSNLRKRESAGRIDAGDVEAHFRNFLTMFPIVVPTKRAIEGYFDLRSRFSLSHWDTMLLAACKEAGITVLYSEDLDPGTDYDGLRVVNPFA